MVGMWGRGALKVGSKMTKRSEILLVEEEVPRKEVQKEVLVRKGNKKGKKKGKGEGEVMIRKGNKKGKREARRHQEVSSIHVYGDTVNR